jgi:hypothetical protein
MFVRTLCSPNYLRCLRGFIYAAFAYRGDVMKHAIHSAIKNSSHETARLMSAHVRAEAHNSGWPEHIARSLHAKHGDDGFTYHVHDEHHAETMNVEYGTPSSQPNAAVRGSGNRTEQAESFFMKRLTNHLGGLL